jgi:hypothetical protein
MTSRQSAWPSVEPWVTITDYPAWPSPYFAQFARYAPAELGLVFRPDLGELDALTDHEHCRPGIVNLHRLKRLYRAQDGSRSSAAAVAMLERLDRLRLAGWRVVWTVHNLLPIDGGPPQQADQAAADGVLKLADAVICHTNADAAFLRTRVVGDRVVVAGWAGLPTQMKASPEPAVAALTERMRRTAISLLLLGNLTAYKDLPATLEQFTATTTEAELFVIGPTRDAELTQRLRHLANRSGGRVHVEVRRVEPDQAGHLYGAATAAVCPYSVAGPYAFFADVLHPSSVGTAVVFGVPVLAPALPSVLEMTVGHPRVLYPPDAGPGEAFTTVESAARTPEGSLQGRRAAADDAVRWRRITDTYRHVKAALSPSTSTGITREEEGAERASTTSMIDVMEGGRC